MKITKGLTWPLLLLSLAALTVFLAGLAALQSSCNDAGVFPGFTDATSSPSGVFGMSAGSCRRVMRFYWFTLAFVFLTLLGIFITAIAGAGLHYSRPFWIGMLAVSTVLMMIASEAFLGFTDNTTYNDGSWIRRMRTAAAGAIITTAFLVLLMMAIGTDWEHRRGHGHDEKFAHTGNVVVTQPGVVPASNVRMVDQV